MNSRRGSASVSADYPEHLNPFHEEDHKTTFWKATTEKKRARSNSFSNAFKDNSIINAIRKSFRGKSSKKDKKEKQPPQQQQQQQQIIAAHVSPVELRRTQNAPSFAASPSRHTLGGYSQKQTAPIVYPRSRFSERLAKEQNNSDTISICSRTSTNPFEIDDDKISNKVYYSGRKKKAPPPPVPHNRDNLTISATSSLSVSMESNLNNEHLGNDTVSVRIEDVSEKSNGFAESSDDLMKQLQNITNELQKLTDNSDNLAIDAEKERSKIDEEDISNEEKPTTISDRRAHHENPSEEILSVGNEDKTDGNVKETDAEIPSVVITSASNEDKQIGTNEESSALQQNGSVTLAEAELYDDLSDDSLSEYTESYYLKSASFVYKSDEHLPNNLELNVATEEKVTVKETIISAKDVGEEKETEIKTTIVTNDNYVGTETISITNTEEHPIPKLRKHKLTKSVLLGNANDYREID